MRDILPTGSKYACDIYIRGSYGPANLGDDVLMMVIAKMVTQTFPEKKVWVSASHPEIAKTFLPDCDYVDLKDPIKCHIAIFGGGGQFFSFKADGTPQNRSITNALKNLSIKSFIQRVFIETKNGKGVAFDATKTAALSLGIGPFENGANDFNYIRAKNNLQRCSFISVRDDMSYKIFQQITSRESRLHTDLSFLREFWLKAPATTSPKEKKHQFGVIPRGWAKDQKPAQHIEDLIRQIQNLNNKPILISFDAKNDEAIIKSLPNFKWLIWDPSKNNPCEFLQAISNQCDYLVSTRAHGVMLAAAVGLPSIAVQIEPKLENIHKYFPNGTTLIKPEQLQDLPNILTDFENETDARSKMLNKEYCIQERIAIQMKNEFLEWMEKNVH